MLNNKIKHNKFTKEWMDWMKVLMGNDVKTKLDEIDKVRKELKEKTDAKENLRLIVKHGLGVERERQRLLTVTNLEPRTKNFKETWQTDGWNKKAQDFYKDYQTNVYLAKINNTDYETTEEQIINTLARVVKALEKVDATDFIAKYNAKEADTGKRKKINDTLTALQIQAKEVIVGRTKDKDGKELKGVQPSYDFSNTYLKGNFKDDKTWKADSTTYSAPAFDYQAFGEFIKLVGEANFLDTLDATKQKYVPASEDWKIFLKGAKWKADKLKDYGIIIDESKTSLYKTDLTQSRTFKVKEGVKGWFSLAQAVFSKENYEKLNQNFTDANNPHQLLLNDGKTYDPATSAWLFPESEEAIEELMIDLETQKLIQAGNIKQEDIQAKEAELDEKEQEFEALIKNALTAKRAELKKLVPDLSKGKGFNKVSDTEDYRKTYDGLADIQRLLFQIRYLENDGDCSKITTVADENTALTNIESIINDTIHSTTNPYMMRKIYNLHGLGAKKVGDKLEYDAKQAITKIKSHGGSIKEFQKLNLTEYKNELEAWATKLKLRDFEEQCLAEIKKELGETPTPPQTPEKLTDWQSKLKALDPKLVETVITETKKSDFEKHNNFKKIADIEKLLIKVIDVNATDATKNKIKDSFKTALKADDTTVDDLAKAITKHDAKKMITLVERFEYDNLSDTGTTDKDKAKTQKKRRLAKLLNKTSESEITDAEINTTLFEIATGAKTLDAKFYNADLTEITTPQDDGGNNQGQPVPWYAKAWYWPVWTSGILIISGVLIYFFWENISNWWSGPSEEEGTEATISDEDDDE